jgi:hypothetical protein
MNTPTINAALVAALGELTNPVKDKTANLGGYSYRYADLATIIDHVRPVLAKHELAVTQNVNTEDGRLEVWTYIHHASGEVITYGPLAGRAGASWQELGGAVTYARRYALSAALGIAPDEDTDANTIPVPPLAKAPVVKEAPKVSEEVYPIVDDPWYTSQEKVDTVRPAAALVGEMLGGLIIKDEYPLRTADMMSDKPSAKQSKWALDLIHKGAEQVGATDLDYLNAVLVDVHYPEVTSFEALGGRACSAIIKHLTGKGK